MSDSSAVPDAPETPRESVAASPHVSAAVCDAPTTRADPEEIATASSPEPPAERTAPTEPPERTGPTESTAPTDTAESTQPTARTGSAVGAVDVAVLHGVVQAGDVDVVGTVRGDALCGGDGADRGLHELLVGDGGTGDDVDLGGVADLGEVVGVLLVGGDGGLCLLVVVLVEDFARRALAVFGTLVGAVGERRLVGGGCDAPAFAVMVMVPIEPWSSALDWAVQVPSLSGLLMSRPVVGVQAARMVAPSAPRTANEAGATQRERLSSVVGVGHRTLSFPLRATPSWPGRTSPEARSSKSWSCHVSLTTLPWSSRISRWPVRRRARRV